MLAKVCSSPDGLLGMPENLAHYSRNFLSITLSVLVAE